MGTFQKAQNQALKLNPKRISLEVFNFIRRIEKEFAAYNKATLNQDSQDTEGNPIGFYSFATELISGGKKKAGDPFDLVETGKFLDELFAEVQGETVFFDTKDEKKDEVLKNLLSDDIFGLQDDDLKDVIDKRIRPFLLQYFRKNLT